MSEPMKVASPYLNAEEAAAYQRKSVKALCGLRKWNDDGSLAVLVGKILIGRRKRFRQALK